jgi:hypothetical protein
MQEKQEYLQREHKVKYNKVLKVKGKYEQLKIKMARVSS